MTGPFEFEFSSTQMTTDLEFSSTQMTTDLEFSSAQRTMDFEFENTIKNGDGIVLPTPIAIEEYNAIPVKDSSAYYFIAG